MAEDHKPDSTVEEPDLSGRYSAKDYLQWKMEDLVELIRGKIFKMSPAPSVNHQRIVRNGARILDAYFQSKSCEYFTAPFDVYLVKEGQHYKENENIVQPDLCVVCDPDKLREIGCIGAPDLVVEILSRSTAKKDQVDKKALYAEYGVPEFWVVFPDTLTVQVFEIKDGAYQLSGTYVEDQDFRSVTFPGLEVDLVEVFRDVGDYGRP